LRPLTKFEETALKRDANVLMDAAKAQLDAMKSEIAHRKNTYHIEESCSSGVEVFTPQDKEGWCELFCEEICPDAMTQKAVFQVLMKIKAPSFGVKLEGCVPLDYVLDDAHYIGNVTFALKTVVNDDGEAHIAVYYAVHKMSWRQKYNLPPNLQWRPDLKAKSALSKRSQYLSAEKLLSSLQLKAEVEDVEVKDVEEKHDMDLGASNDEDHSSEYHMVDHVPPPQQPTPPPPQKPIPPQKPVPPQRPIPAERTKHHRGKEDWTQWTVHRVLCWIYELELDLEIENKTLGEHFRRQDVDGAALKDMEKDDLTLLGIIDFNDLKKIWRRISALQRHRFV